MLTLNKLFFALAFLGGSAAVQAENLPGALVRANAGERINKGNAGLQTAEYHYYSATRNISGTHNGIKVSPSALLGSFDPKHRPTYIF
ncbi:hypothetical protein QN386_15685 [Pseudomonas sp. CCI3.2]|uniref:hypothetical protein n=1 Tax=unclassified Pseudomonas TaxID=196821 RepID=UPI002AC96FDF|nr:MULTISPECIES: hypothetical protein [unclassified Pseudomonas]MEB0075847.1 hypothetical protein [Pseudomonas sp. MH10out]MEB0091689.1 hypothetical protein [Pseudomonas sp. CCI4.2]MEB0102755.1 hypothetical protein [Pseudomonas sp. CCI3.2]MEB0131601.1 hypothetical protein [Pseudomonas sp. CCI2.4]MEB0156494.1 hypothetical protein [Pseudomonas sp. AH2 (2023)]